MGLIANIADAVVTLLNSHEFSESFTAVRSYSPKWDLPGLKTLRVMVIPKSIEIELESRSQNRKTVSVDIAVIKKYEDAGNSENDDYLQLVEDIADYLTRKHLESPAAKWTKTEIPAIYDGESFDQKRTYVAQITVTYMVIA